MLNIQVPNNLIEKLSKEIANNININTLELGLDYFKKGRIKQIALKNSTVTAIVKGTGLYTGLYTVSIDLNDFSQSRCSCPEGKYCKHTAATFFDLYSQYDEPYSFFKDYKSKTRGQASTAPVRQTGSTEKSAATAQKKARSKNTGVKQTKPLKEVDSWYYHFEKTFNLIFKENELYINPWGFYFNHTYLFEMVYIKFRDTPYPLSQDWPKEKTDIYRLNAIIFFLTQLEKLNEQRGNIHITQGVFDLYTKDLQDNMPQRLTLEKKDEYVQFLIKSVNIINRHLLLNNNLIFDWLHIFRLMWSNVFNHPIWIQRVYDLLEDVRKKAEASTPKYYYLSLGLAHFKVMAKRDEEARALLQGLEFSSLNVFYYYLSFFRQSNEWDRLLAWLSWLSPLVQKANNVDFETICKYWIIVAENTRSSDEMEKQLIAWLPRSCNVLAEFLLKSNRYGDWTDLHICYARKFFLEARSNHMAGVSSYELSLVEAQELQALLPLYHQRIVQYLDEKNRKAYQEAVKLLKKLRAVYNKLKLKDEWKNFILRLVKHYQRNKAFHEELRKGKLIT